MSYFSFKRDADGEIQTDDGDILEALEILVNQMVLLNIRFEEAFQTEIQRGDITDEDRGR